MQEIDRFLTIHQEIKKEQILSGSEDISDKMKHKLSELLFSQLLPYVNNMNEFKVGLKNIVKITDAFCEKYKFLGDEHKESIFALVSDNKDEIERLRKECKNEKSLLTIYNNDNTNKKTNNITKDGNINNNKNNVNKNTNINNNVIKKTNENKFTNKDNTKNANINNNTNKNINTNKNTNSNTNKNINANKNTNSNTNKNTNISINKNNTNNKIGADVYRCHTVAESSNFPKNKSTSNESDKKNNEGSIFDKIGTIFSNLASNIMDKKEEKKEEKKEAKKEEKKEAKKEEKKEVKKEEKKEVKKDDKKDVKKDIKQENKYIPKKEEKIDKLIKKDTPMEKRPAMIKPISSQNNNNTNPFGVVLKKVPK